MRGATLPLRGASGYWYISTHAPLAGRDPPCESGEPLSHRFQPTRPLRGATLWIGSVIRSSSFQPTRPLRGATVPSEDNFYSMRISTHAPLAGRDSPSKAYLSIFMDFNPRAPCGARRTLGGRTEDFTYFNPRAPCGARRLYGSICGGAKSISTHAPLAGRDGSRNTNSFHASSFQPTRPLRGATVVLSHGTGSSVFQPTRPLRGATVLPVKHTTSPTAFQPTRPLRGATKSALPVSTPTVFQPTRPLRGATNYNGAGQRKQNYFNPRAPCGARLGNDHELADYLEHFNPRAPCGARPASIIFSISLDVFQPTRPLRGATAMRDVSLLVGVISTHAPLAGRDGFVSLAPACFQISTHAPLAGRDSKSVQITMHIFAITDKFQMLLHRMPPVRAFCSFLMQENHADFGCEPPK